MIILSMTERLGHLVKASVIIIDDDDDDDNNDNDDTDGNDTSRDSN